MFSAAVLFSENVSKRSNGTNRWEPFGTVRCLSLDRTGQDEKISVDSNGIRLADEF